MTPAEEKQFLADAEADAVERMAQLERALGPDFDPRKQDEDDRAHVAVLLMRDRREGLREALTASRLEIEALDASIGEHKRVIASLRIGEAKQQAAIDKLVVGLYLAKQRIEGAVESWFVSRSRLRRAAADAAERIAPHRKRLDAMFLDGFRNLIRGLREEEARRD